MFNKTKTRMMCGEYGASLLAAFAFGNQDIKLNCTTSDDDKYAMLHYRCSDFKNRKLMKEPFIQKAIQSGKLWVVY